MLSKTVKST